MLHGDIVQRGNTADVDETMRGLVCKLWELRSADCERRERHDTRVQVPFDLESVAVD